MSRTNVTDPADYIVNGASIGDLSCLDWAQSVVQLVKKVPTELLSRGRRSLRDILAQKGSSWTVERRVGVTLPMLKVAGAAWHLNTDTRIFVCGSSYRMPSNYKEAPTRMVPCNDRPDAPSYPELVDIEGSHLAFTKKRDFLEVRVRWCPKVEWHSVHDSDYPKEFYYALQTESLQVRLLNVDELGEYFEKLLPGKHQDNPPGASVMMAIWRALGEERDFHQAQQRWANGSRKVVEGALTRAGFDFLFR